MMIKLPDLSGAIGSIMTPRSVPMTLCFAAVLFGACAHLGNAFTNVQQQKQCQHHGDVWTPSGEWHTGDYS